MSEARGAFEGGLAIVLAGGASSRMGEPKASLLVEGQPLLARVVRTAAAVSDRVVVLAEPGRALPDASVSGPDTDVERVDDPEHARFGGPLRALGHLLAAREGEVRAAARVLLLGVDHPAVDEDVTRAMTRRWLAVRAAAASRGAPMPAALVPRDPARGSQPLLAIYDGSALVEGVARLVQGGERRLRAILDVLAPVEWVEIEDIGPSELGWPCNTPAELARALDALATRRRRTSVADSP